MAERYFKEYQQELMKFKKGYSDYPYQDWLEDQLKLALEKNRQYEDLLLKDNNPF